MKDLKQSTQVLRDQQSFLGSALKSDDLLYPKQQLNPGQQRLTHCQNTSQTRSADRGWRPLFSVGIQNSSRMVFGLALGFF